MENQLIKSVENVGIHAIEIYFPSTYVSQDELEVFDKAPKGKYTIGLGQLSMAVVNDREDINSICLTVVQNLLDKYHIKTSRIGRLEVGTETLIDKSKSVKTTLMQLFAQSRSHDIEGVTSINACYGGTNALFNTINWVQSQAYDGRYGLVVCADVAVYPKGPARPTGGVGAIAMLIGPNAPIVFDNVRSTFIDNAYDFYKPVPNSEYPTVDGHLSINVYLNALAKCYETFKAKNRQNYKGYEPKYYDFDYFCFHTPFSKMVQKSFFHMLFQDLQQYANQGYFSKEVIEELKQSNFVNDEKAQKIMMKYFQGDWKNKCERSLLLAKQLGNIYTGSLYNGLISLIGDTSIDLKGKKILMFSYGSGCAASMFLVKVVGDYKKIQDFSNFKPRLDSRVKISPEEFDKWMAAREANFGKAPYQPTGSIDSLFDNTFFLQNIDEKYRRFYALKEGEKSVQLDPFNQNLSSQKTVNRLNNLNRQLTSDHKAEIDSSVLRSVIVNFHKKPLQE